MDVFKLKGTIEVDNDEANKSIDETTEKAKESEKQQSSAFSKIASAASTVGKGFLAAGAGAVALGGSILGLSNSTMEYSEDMGKLTVAFDQHNFSAETAKGVYQDFVGILGESDQAVEAANHLAQLCDSQEQLSQWTDIASGVYATFGDSLPLEGLTEAANETARVAQVTGPFADALNWANVSTEQFTAGLQGHKGAMDAFNKAISDGETREDAFTAALQACSNEQERGQIVTDTLTSLYGEAGQQYQETNADLIEARQAQADWNAAVGEAGEAVRPLANRITEFGTALVEKALPYIERLPDLLDAAGQKVNDFKTWVSENQGTINAWGGILTGLIGTIGTFVAIMGFSSVLNKAKTAIAGVRTAMVAFNAVLAANPIGIVVSVIAGLVAALIYLWNTNESFRNALISAWNAISSTAMAVFGAIGSFLSGVFSGIQSVALSVWAAIQSGIQTVGNVIQTIWTTVQTVTMTVWNAILGFLTPIITAIITVIAVTLGTIINIVTTIWNGVSSVTMTVWNAISSFLSPIVNAIRTTISNVFNAIKSVVTTVWNGVRSVTSTVWNAISSFISSVVNAIRSVVSSVFNAIKSVVTTVWNGIKTATSTVWNGIKTAVSTVVNGIKTTVTNVFNAVKSTVTNVWNGIKSAIEKPINSARDLVKSAIDKIKGFFNFKISWPHIPLPHFSINPSGWTVGDLLKGSIPSLGISWYAKGGVFDQPTILPTAEGLAGVGEAGPEAVAPISVLTDYVRDAVRAENAQTAAAIDRLIAMLADYLPRILAGQDREVVLDTGALVGGIAGRMDRRLGDINRLRGRGQ